MTIRAGSLLVATPSLTDPNFSRTVIAILEHTSEDGTVGVIVNRPTDIDVVDHLPWLDGAVSEPGVVFIGGPVRREVAVGVALNDLGLPVLVEDLDDPPVGPLRIFSGYSGWGVGQLEGELADDAWVVVDAEPDDTFDQDPRTLWSRVLRRQDGYIAMLATYPADLSSN